MRKYAMLALMAILPLGAARLTLRDGTVVYGQFISGTSDNIVFQDDNGVRRQFGLHQVRGIDFDNAAGPATTPRGESNSANRIDRNRREFAVLPAGTSITVRNDQDINSQNTAEGHTFPASIVEDVTDSNGNVAIPRGSRATLIVRRINEGGTLTSGNYVLDLDSVTVNGRRYVVSTEDIETGEKGIGKNKRTGEYVGGGAVLGTLLGAIAGGGKGAAIGAIAGAAAGGGAQVLTKGKELRVPAETALHFRLDQPLHLREAA
jgi:hypothetical protein